MIIQSVPALRLQFDPAFSLLRSAWVPGTPASAYRASCEGLLDVSEAHGARHYLLDMREVPDISIYDQLWLSRVWVPRALKLPAERVVYCNQSERVYNQLAIESLLHLAQPFLRCDIQFFTQPTAALTWLVDYDYPAHAALLAEWQAHYGPTPADSDELAEPPTPYYSSGRQPGKSA